MTNHNCYLCGKKGQGSSINYVRQFLIYIPIYHAFQDKVSVISSWNLQALPTLRPWPLLWTTPNQAKAGLSHCFAVTFFKKRDLILFSHQTKISNFETDKKQEHEKNNQKIFVQQKKWTLLIQNWTIFLPDSWKFPFTFFKDVTI